MANKFRKKLLEVEYLEKMFNLLESEEKDVCTDYRPTGEKEQDRNWRTNELKFDENGDPVMRDIYNYVTVDESELTDDARDRLRIIRDLKVKLEKLL